MNNNFFDAFPYFHQMNDQFRQLFGDDFVQNLMNSMQLPNQWWQGQTGAPNGGQRGPTGEGGGESRFRNPENRGNPSTAQGLGQQFQGPGWPSGTGAWNPFAGAAGQGAAPSGTAFPVADIYETRHEVVLVAEIPGMERASDIKLSVFSDHVTLKGQLQRRYSQMAGESLAASERFVGSFERTFTLPAPVRRQHARATYRSGLLEVRLLKEGRSQDGDGTTLDVDFV